MSDETENEDKANLIGVDPLAWLSEEEKASVINENKENEIIDFDNEADAGAENKAHLIKLNSVLTIRDVSELMEELNNISADQTELVFESDNIEKIDAAALQLLSGFYLFSIDAGKKVTWQEPSETFCHAAELLGLKEIINLPSAA